MTNKTNKFDDITPLPFKICSLPRSGTHFLMCSLWANFDFGVDLTNKDFIPFPPEMIFKGPGVEIREDERFGGRLLYVPWAELFISHEERAKINLPDSQIVYLTRSNQKLWEAQRRFYNPGSMDDKQKWFRMFDAHKTTFASPDIYKIDYDTLLANFGERMNRIQKQFNLTRRQVLVPTGGPGVDGWEFPPRVGFFNTTHDKRFTDEST